ncbi:hypothetical protein [Salinicola acroporae]|nr:hypothetical protein [Salinicola acroporae]
MEDKLLLVLAGIALCQSFWGVVITGNWSGAVVMVPLAVLAIRMAGGPQ